MKYSFNPSVKPFDVNTDGSVVKFQGADIKIETELKPEEYTTVIKSIPEIVKEVKNAVVDINREL